MPYQLAPLRHRNFRLFFFGQITSLTGTWMQQVAHGWLVVQLTTAQERALVIGAVSAITALPILLFSLPAGVVADRFPKRSVILTAQSISMAMAFVLAALTFWDIVTVRHLMLIGFVLGMAHAFDAPARQSFLIEMVGRDDLPTAITLNSAMFNGARVLGPAVAGLAIAAIGLSGAFFLNGISFLAVIAGLLLIRVTPFSPAVRTSVLAGLREGLGFVRGNRMVSALLMLTAGVSIFGTSYVILMPIFAKEVFRTDAGGLGYLMSSVGLGALAGAVTLSSIGDFKWRGKMLLIGNSVFCAMLLLFSTTSRMYVALPILFFAGWGIMINTALTNTLIQTAVPDHLRGRVISVYTWLFLGMAPLGSMQAGALAHWLGAPVAVRIGAVVLLASALLLSPRFAGGRMRDS